MTSSYSGSVLKPGSTSSDEQVDGLTYKADDEVKTPLCRLLYKFVESTTNPTQEDETKNTNNK
jgi:hypothetical protein